MPSILVADSRIDDRALLVRAFERLGWDVWYATTPQEVQLALSELQLDFIVASHELALSGDPSLWSQLCEQAPSTSNCPVLILPELSDNPRTPILMHPRGRLPDLTCLNLMVIAACQSISPEINPASRSRLDWPHCGTYSDN